MSEWQFVLAFWSVSFFALLCVWCLVDMVCEQIDRWRHRKDFGELIQFSDYQKTMRRGGA